MRLMEQEAIHDYLERYFLANECNILENKDGILKVKLTIDVDKRLINRPFYWHYIEQIGGQPETKTLVLKTKQHDHIDGEFIHAGSPRLHQILNSTKELASYIRLYQDVHNRDEKFTPLEPWLSVNFKISYQCDLKKDHILSLGLHLIKGTILDNFHQTLTQIPLTPKIPNYCYTLKPMIKPISGLKRLESIIENQIQQDDHTWAQKAKQRWQHDQQLLDKFYEGDITKDETYEQEKLALQSQYEPSIHIDVINGGIYYLANHLLN